ncbi:MAG: 4-hydroxythreonine-4-phosphate dehydrogenase PdxA [Bacteroidales bacterium]|nr:4-hydroxythreonine-4-phosphate dehydrogenase PdxA [Bacteroidales bacterium]
MSQHTPIKVGITHGDINGISYELILKALEDNRILELCTPVIYGSAKIAALYRKMIQHPGIPLVQVASGADARHGEYNIVNVVAEDTKVDTGQSTPVAGQAAFVALERAVADLRNGDIDVLVTAPINKHNIQSPTFTFPGHTEYLEASLGEEGDKALMILCTDKLRVALVTAHTPLSKVAESITEDNIVERLKAFNLSLQKDFGVTQPRIAVLSLNPHAGEQGLLGKEEQEVIIPAIKKAQEAKINCFGPYASDGFFGSGQFAHFDGVLAMYHDQGLTPFKTLAMDSGVNFTAGLPYVRTSPDHGTAYDIAGKGQASPSSMREALYMAIDIWRNRQRYATAHANPLRKQYVEKNKTDNVVLDLTKSSDEE